MVNYSSYNSYNTQALRLARKVQTSCCVKQKKLNKWPQPQLKGINKIGIYVPQSGFSNASLF